MGPGKSQSVHLPVRESSCAGGMPLLIPPDRLFPCLNTFLKAVPIRKSVFLLVLQQSGGILAVIAVILQRNLCRIKTEFCRNLLQDEGKAEDIGQLLTAVPPCGCYAYIYNDRL